MNFENIPDPIQAYSNTIDVGAVLAAREEALKKVAALKSWNSVRDLLKVQPLPQQGISIKQLTGDRITIGSPEDLNEEQHTLLSSLIHSLVPWRVGPYSIFGHEVDAEWKSQFKWNRIKEYLGDISDKRVLDIGSNNGYFMFRMLKYEPQLVLGIDPVYRCGFQFEFLQRYIQSPRLAFEPIGILDLNLFPKMFHLAVCMGVIYHQRDPFTALRRVYDSLLPKGRIVLESIAIPGDEPHALCPPERYTKMRNAWYIPTASCMASWLSRVGFEDIEIVCFEKTSIEEQSKTELAPDESLEDFLDPEDPSKTVEGFPAPHRAVVTAKKLKRQ